MKFHDQENERRNRKAVAVFQALGREAPPPIVHSWRTDVLAYRCTDSNCERIHSGGLPVAIYEDGLTLIATEGDGDQQAIRVTKAELVQHIADCQEALRLMP